MDSRLCGNDEQEVAPLSFGMSNTDLDALCINTVRTLSMDAVQKANSGHPGAPMGLAPVAYVLWNRFLKDRKSVV